MMHRLFLSWMAVVILLLQSPAAKAVEEGFSVWNGIFIRGQLSGRWGYYLEEQVRLSDGSELDPLRTRGNRWILRPALVWDVPSISGLQVFVGGALTPNFSPERGEQRLWEQLQYSYPVKASVLVQRLRFEQRHVQLTQGIAQRVRYQSRFAHGGSLEDPMGYVIWDEVFWNLNTVPGGPKSGFDQNRLFVGPMVRISPRSRLEAGYLANWIGRGTAPSAQWSHVLALFMDLDFSPKRE